MEGEAAATARMKSSAPTRRRRRYSTRPAAEKGEVCGNQSPPAGRWRAAWKPRNITSAEVRGGSFFTFQVASFRRHRHNVADLCRACLDQALPPSGPPSSILQPRSSLTTNRPDGHHDASTSCARTSARIVFTGGRGDFFRLVGRGALLELITAGLYRFWLATDISRALWSGTSVDGDPPEYTGTAKELLLGFLFALAILVPIYVLYFLIGIEAERAKAFASVPLFLFF